MQLYWVHRPDAFWVAAEGIVAALAEARDGPGLDQILIRWIKRLGFLSAGHIRVFGEGQFHRAEYLFRHTALGWAERYQNSNIR